MNPTPPPNPPNPPTGPPNPPNGSYGGFSPYATGAYPSSPVKPVRGAAYAAMTALGLHALTLLVFGGAALWTLYLLGTAEIDEGLLDLHDAVITVLAVQGSAGFVLAAVTVIVWLWRARTNAEVISGSPQHWGRPWIIFGWVVPILNLFVPRRIVGDVWEAVAPSKGTALINAWWTLWLVYLVGDQVAGRMDGESSLDAMRAQLQAFVLLAPVGIAAAVLAILVVWRITRHQEQHADRIAQAIAAPPPNPQP
ncbi:MULTISPECIES: DUF4328 domain-containing protein [Actinomadura]|uniref:DUF4328 domain-containing protein n=1 Tax=Actinomadura yumaensis TaxID=111807 RepID=A0ABW2CR45_9ACTN|nr:DUF4328 domain-containing protein [Actinomadura sp. J1-007]MWK35956.1 DUF4328 domain-containing protein [Actinomadura sp. J1-007]